MNLRIKMLKNEIGKNGYDYILVKRHEKGAIYSQNNGRGNIIAYEVFKHKLVKPHPKSIDVNEWDKVESFPGDEEFGIRAWTYPNLELAEKRFLAL